MSPRLAVSKGARTAASATAALHIRGVGKRRQQDHGQAGQTLIPADATAEFVTVHAGHVHIAHHGEGKCAGTNERKRLGAVAGVAHGEAVLLEDEAQVDRAGLQVGPADDVNLGAQVPHLAVVLAELVGGGVDVGVGAGARSPAIRA